MSSLINSTRQTPADVVTLNQVRASSVKKETPTGKEISRSTAAPITLPEDVVILSSAVKGEDGAATKKIRSVAVSNAEKKALLSSDFTPKGFSVYG